MGSFTTLMILQHQHKMITRMIEDDERRRKEREAQRKREEEEERRRKAEHRKMIEHRKNSPVICNDEDWQINRCVKAVSMQPFVKEFVEAVDKVKPAVIEREEKVYDERLIETGYEYEQSKRTLDNDIEALKKLGITVDGSEYKLDRIAPTDTNIAKPEKEVESFGNIFTINDGQPIELTPSTLSSENYFEGRYRDMNPEEIEREYTKTNSKMDKYQKVGKVLKFLLKTKTYQHLEEKKEGLVEKRETCETLKRELQSYRSLNKEQLLVIKSYFTHLDELKKISVKIGNLFIEKEGLRYPVNENVHDLAIKEVMSMEEYRELVSQTHEYVSRIYENDEETMKGAYELVKGEYPIEVDRRYIYDLIISNMRSYTREGIKELKLK